MRNKSVAATDQDVLPSVVKRKLEKNKIDGRLINKKDLVLGTYVTVRSKENIGSHKIKIALEVLNFSSLEKIPIIPQYGKLITEPLHIIVTDVKGLEMQKKGNMTYSIKSPEVDAYCYPLLFVNDDWRIAENFTVESDGISISDSNWNIVMLVKEPPNEIITITSNGGMIYSELDKVTCLRIPKGNFRENVNCKVQFVDMSMEYLADFQSVYEDQLNPFAQLSQLFVVQLIDQNRELIYDEQGLRRAISIKIPLPDWVISKLNDINFDTKKTVQDQRKEKLGFYLLQKFGDTWDFFEGNLKFTQASLGFDTKYFGSFIFVTCQQNREIRLCSSMALVENLHSCERGVVLVFLWIKRQQWFLWVELVPMTRINSVRQNMESNGLLFIEQSHECQIVDPINKGRRMSRTKKESIMRRTTDLSEQIQFKLSVNGDIEKCEEVSHQTNNIIKDLKNDSKENESETEKLNNFSDFDRIGKRKVTIVEPKDEIAEIIVADISYHRYAQQSNAIIVPIKPKDQPIANWTKNILDNLKKKSIYESSVTVKQEAVKIPINEDIRTDIDLQLIEPKEADQINLSKLSDHEKEFNFQCEVGLEAVNLRSNQIMVSSQKFKFCIPVETMKDYFNVLTNEEKQELEIERLKLENEQITMEKQSEQETVIYREPNRPKMVNYNRIDRLSNPRTKQTAILRDPKVLSSKSMLALASTVRQGLTLAVYLSLPENVIAGIGFDSLSQMSMNRTNNTTYKVLVTWKKMIHINKLSENEYMENLMDALRTLNYSNLSALIYEHWKDNKEISIEDCQRCMLTRNDL